MGHVYTVTYPNSKDFDHECSWEYLKSLAQADTKQPGLFTGAVASIESGRPERLKLRHNKTTGSYWEMTNASD